MLLAFLVRCSTSRTLPTKKFAPALTFRHFENFWNIQCSFNLTSDIKRSPQIMQEKIFSWWWGHRWRHRKTSKSSLYIPLLMKNEFCRNNWTNTRDIIIILSVYMYHRIVNVCISLVMDYITDDVIRAPNRSKRRTAIALSIFKLEHRSKAQNVTNAHGYRCNMFNFRCHFQ